jgi:hypothetical protein
MQTLIAMNYIHVHAYNYFIIYLFLVFLISSYLYENRNYFILYAFISIFQYYSSQQFLI